MFIIRELRIRSMSTEYALTGSPWIRVSTEFRRHGIPRNFLTSEVISAQFRRNSAKFRGIPRNFAGIAPEITSVFRGMPKCHFRGHPTMDLFNMYYYNVVEVDRLRFIGPRCGLPRWQRQVLLGAGPRCGRTWWQVLLGAGRRCGRPRRQVCLAQVPDAVGCGLVVSEGKYLPDVFAAFWTSGKNRTLGRFCSDKKIN